MILPPSVTGYFLLILLGKRGAIGSILIQTFGFKIIFTWYAAVIAASVVSLPLMYQNVKAAFLNVDPAYERAARTLGSSESKNLLDYHLSAGLARYYQRHCAGLLPSHRRIWCHP